MHINWDEVWNYFWGNKLALSAALSVAYLVFVKTMPPPTISWRDPEVKKTWFYNYTHVLSHQDAFPYPQPAPYPAPENPALAAESPHST